MDLVLIKDWNGLRSGFHMAGVPGGQAEQLVLRGIAKYENDNANSRSDIGTVERTDNAERSQEAIGNKRERRRTR
jgi:hypothetical protein